MVGDRFGTVDDMAMAFVMAFVDCVWEKERQEGQEAKEAKMEKTEKSVIGFGQVEEYKAKVDARDAEAQYLLGFM